MSHFDPSRMLSFDLETTSKDPLTAHIVTAALVDIAGAKVDSMELLANPGVPIDPGATAVHGITDEHAQSNGRPHDEVLDSIIERIYAGWDDGATLIVFNAPFDLTILRQHRPDFVVKGLVYDPLIIDRYFDQRKERRTLTNLCAFYGITNAKAHEATSDSLASARVAWKQAKLWPQVTRCSGDELMELQAMGHYEFCERLRHYFQKRDGRSEEIDTGWPIKNGSH